MNFFKKLGNKVFHKKHPRKVKFGEVIMLPEIESEDYSSKVYLHPDGTPILTADHKLWAPKNKEEYAAWKQKAKARGMFTICPACMGFGTVKWNPDTDICTCRRCGWVERKGEYANV